MENITAIAIRSLIFLPAFLWVLSSVGEAAKTQVDCSSASLQTAVDRAKPGDTLLVSGTCNEHVVIPFEVVRVTLDGQGKATINGPTASKPCILVNGRGITIKGFTITGGRGGIWVFGGGQAAIIDGNTIQSGEVNGVLVHRSSTAVIVNNTIQNARRIAGIQVNGNSFAFIGVLSGLDKVARPNIIQNNEHGINVFRSSNARIVGNTISNNQGYGVEVTRGSHAEIAGNKIDGNGRGGILIVRGAGADLGSSRGKRIFDQPNKTTAKNGGFGIRCSRGGYVGGRLGTLNGEKGEKSFEEGCVDSIRP